MVVAAYRDVQQLLDLLRAHGTQRERIVDGLPEDLESARVLHHVTLERRLIEVVDILQRLQYAALGKLVEVQWNRAEL